MESEQESGVEELSAMPLTKTKNWLELNLNQRTLLLQL